MKKNQNTGRKLIYNQYTCEKELNTLLENWPKKYDLLPVLPFERARHRTNWNHEVSSKAHDLVSDTRICAKQVETMRSPARLMIWSQTPGSVLSR